MLDSLTRIIADRSVGAIFSGNYKLMDYELMGGDGRNAIIAQDTQRGMTPVLPPAVPFGSHQWPALITTHRDRHCGPLRREVVCGDEPGPVPFERWRVP